MYMFWCVAFIVITCGYGLSGEYWPGSYYTIDQNGNQAENIPLNKDTIIRFRRNAANGGGYAGSFGNGGYGGGYSSGGGGYSGGYGGGYGGGPDFVFDGPTSGIAGAVQSGLDDTFNQLRSLAGETAFNGANGGGGGRAYSGSFSSGGSHGSPGQGGVLHSRFAGGGNGGYEREYVTGGNSGIQASSSAQGPHGAFSFSSSSTDENGRVNYQTRAHKF